MMAISQGLSSVVFMVLFTIPAAAAPPTEFYQDFRGGRFPDALFQKVGADPIRQVRAESTGLRIQLPAATKNWPQTGIMTRFQVCGDFEITLSYELLTLEPPRTGYGSGLALVVCADQGQGLAALARSWRVQEGSVYVMDRAPEQGEGQLQHDEHTVSTAAKAGKLRLQRIGAKIHYLVADGAEESFRELSQAPFGKADLSAMQVVGDTGWSPTALDVLVKDLRFRAEGLPMAGQKTPSRGWLLWSASMSLLGVAALAVFVAVWKHRRRRTVPLSIKYRGK